MSLSLDTSQGTKGENHTLMGYQVTNGSYINAIYHYLPLKTSLPFCYLLSSGYAMPFRLWFIHCGYS